MLDGGMPYSSFACLIESFFCLIASSANHIDSSDHAHLLPDVIFFHGLLEQDLLEHGYLF
jgi:hypothetical protein